jgi:sugar phosphate isomerase/epimerase
MKKSITRKEFVKLASSAALAIPLTSFLACTPKKEKQAEESATSQPEEKWPLYSSHPGLQLYTLRDAFAKDPSGTLKKIAEIGFKEIELFSPDQLGLTKEISDLGMKVVSTHFLSGYVTGMWDAVKQFGIPKPANTVEDIIDSCAKNDVHYMGISILFPDERKTLDDYKRISEMCNKVGEKAKAAGVQLYYHNHSFEFEPMDDTTPLDEMLKILDANLVKMELDLFWTTISGNDATEWIKKLGDRVKMLHLKDLKAGTPKDYTTFKAPQEAFQAMGDGIVDFKKILAAAAEAKVPYTFVEQDHSAIDPFESIARSYKYLQSLGM